MPTTPYTITDPDLADATSQVADVYAAVRAGYAAGLCLLPTRSDGSEQSKAPDVPTWIPFQTARPTVEQMSGFDFAQRSGFGMIAGPVSGCCESWDFDSADVFEAFVREAEAGRLGDVVRRIRAGYEDQTPAGGRRWIVSYPSSVTWKDCTFARRPGREGEPNTKTLIELPTFAVLAPSGGRTHSTGKPYVHISGDFTVIARYTSDEREALIELARTFDQMPRREAGPRPTATGDRPGDDYNRRATWPEILEPAGWAYLYTRDGTAAWGRPGKTDVRAANTNHNGLDLLRVFSGSTTFDTEMSYSKFAAYTTLHHGGDYAAAAKALAARGYGQATPDASAPLELTALSDLLAEPDETVDYIVENRIAFGSMNLLSAKPKAGKSTLARACALEVARGGVWLGCVCLPRPVWYVVLEDKRSEVRSHFRTMGAVGSEPVRFLFSQRADGLLVQLHALAEREHPGLIIIDTLQRLIKAKDLNDYAEVTTKLTPILSLARETGAAVLLIHHAGKSGRAGIDAVLGSTALTGSVDNVFLLSRTDRYRVLSSTQRIGPDLPETVILLDPVTLCVSAGASRHDADRAAVETAILDVLRDAPEPQTEAQLDEAVEGRTKLKREALRTLVKTGPVSRSGRGGKGKPFLYSLPVPEGRNAGTTDDPDASDTRSRSVVPDYMREQGNKKKSFSDSPMVDETSACSRVPEPEAPGVTQKVAPPAEPDAPPPGTPEGIAAQFALLDDDPAPPDDPAPVAPPDDDPD
jgi:AAA domain